MKVRDKRGFITAIISTILAIVCIAVFLGYKEQRYMISFFILIAFSTLNFVRAFSKDGILEELEENADERDLYLTMKSSHLVVKIMNYTIFTCTIIFLLLYGIMKHSYYIVIATTLCSVLILMTLVFLAVNIYLEKHE